MPPLARMRGRVKWPWMMDATHSAALRRLALVNTGRIDLAAPPLVDGGRRDRGRMRSAQRKLPEPNAGQALRNARRHASRSCPHSVGDQYQAAGRDAELMKSTSSASHAWVAHPRRTYCASSGMGTQAGVLLIP